jgi:hypothetical protein
MATTVFLSHTEADRELVQKVSDHARPLEVSTYAYEEDPQAGSPLALKLEGRIRSADAVIVLLTKKSQHRPSVHTEIGLARAFGKPIIPVIEVGVDPLQFVFLQGLEWITLDLDHAEEALLSIQHSLARLKHLAQANANKLLGAAILLVVAAILFYATSSDS